MIEAKPPSHRVRWGIEVVVVLCLAVLPDLVRALMLDPSKYSNAPPWQGWLAIIIRSVEVTPVVLYLIYRSGEGWEAFGIRRFRVGRDLIWAFVWAFLYLTVNTFFSGLLYSLGDHEPSRTTAYFRNQFSTTGWQTGILFVSLVLNSVAEEVVARSFLITRFEGLLRSRAAAIALSGLLFASYHIYQGVTSALLVWIGGIVLGLAFTWSRSLALVVIVHTLVNLSIMTMYRR